MNKVEIEFDKALDAQNQTILIVDDEPANLAVVADYLAQSGFQIKVTQTGEAGLELARRTPPDLILLDVRLPDVDGFEVCRRLKADERTRQIPVIFMTVLTRVDDKVKGFEVGGMDYISKPFQQEEVLARITTHLRIRDLTQKLKEAKESLEVRVVERTSALAQTNVRLKDEITERIEVEESLRQERDLVARIMETSPVGITIIQRDGRITFANSQAEKVLGLTKDTITQRTYNAPDWHITDYRGDPFPNEQLPFQRVMSTGEPVHDVQHAIVWPDGQRVFLSINGAPLLDEAGEVESVVCTIEDVTERKRAEQALRRLNRELRAISNCNQILMRAEDEQTLLNDICRIVCDEAGYRMAWVGYAGNDETKTVRPVAWAGIEEGYLATANITWADTERGHGPSGRAIRSGKAHSIQDFTTAPLAAPWRDSALQRGYRSTIALPLRDENATPFGVLCIYSTEPNAFTPDEIRLLDELAGDLAFGIVVLRARAERKRAEEALRQSEELLRVTLTNILDPVFITDDDGKFTFICPNVRETLGYSVEEVQALGYISKLVGDGLFNPEELETRGEIFNIERLMVDNFGRQRIFLATIKRVSIGEGTRLYAFHDITERKQAEDALSESETRFRAVFENSVDAIGVSKAGIHTFVNPAYLALYGYADNAELAGISILDLIAPSHREQILENVRRRASGQPVPVVYETRGLRKDGSEFDMDVHVSTYELNGEVFTVPIFRDITERKQAEKERLAHLRFFECMDQINRAIQGRNDLEQMMSDVLDVLLAIFDCDRAWLVYPCDPEAAMWQTSMERTRPEYPGVLPVGVELPLDPVGAAVFRILRDANGPVIFGPGSQHQVPEVLTQIFRVQSFITMAFYPKIGQPWSFGLHQCSYPRVWTPEEERLFQEIGRRLADALTSLLVYRDLSESESKFRRFVESSSEGFTLVDEQGAIIEWNPAREKITGLPASQVIGQRLWDVQYQMILPELQTPEFYERFKQTLLDALQTGQSPLFDHVIEAEVLHPHSPSQFIQQTIFPIKTDKGYRLGSVTRDVTERKRAEDALQESEARYRTLFTQAPDAIFLENEHDEILDVNPAACMLLGYSREELLGMRVSDLQSPEMREQLGDIVKNELSRHGGAPFESVDIRKDGSRVAIEISDSWMGDSGLVLSIVRDITERKRVEDAMLFVAQRGWQISGENFFDALAQFLGEKLDMDYVLIDRIDENPEMAETVALYAKGAITPNMRYALKGTPCENVMGRRLCVYPQGIQQLFPEDPLLLGMGAESYIGIPLWDSTGQPIGLIAVMGTKPLPDDAPVTQLLQLVATRAAAELERERSDRLLRKREQEFRTLAENSPDVIVRYDREGRRIYVNPEFERVNHLSAQEVQGKTPVELSTELVPKADVFTEKLMAAMASGTADKIDLSWTKDGKLVCWFVRVVPEFDTDGKVVSALTIWSNISERKQMEEALRTTKILLEQTIMQSPVPMVLVSMPDVMIRYVNPAARHFLGIDDEPDPTNTPLMDLKISFRDFDLQGKEGFLEELPLVRTLKGIKTEGEERYIVRKDGTIRYELVSGAPIFDDIGQIIAGYLIMADITERKRAEEALHQSEERFRRLAENARDVIYRMSIPDGKYEYVSSAALSVFGYSPEECYQTAPLIKQAIHPAWQMYFEEQWTNLIKGEMPPTYEYQFIHKSGEVRWLNQRNILVRDHAGNPIAIEGIVTDITERKQAEMELSRERELLRTLVDNMPEEVYVKDRERRFLLANELVVHALSAQSIDEIIGKRDEDFMPPDLAKQFADEEDEIMRTGKPLIDDENTPPFKPGPDRWYMRTKIPLRDGAGNIIGLAGLGSDITQRKLAEEKIHKLNLELEQRVLDRTAELEAANKEMEAANKELEAFAYSVSHDLRAPLRHINGFLELLNQKIATTLDEQGQHYMTVLADAARRMGTLIDDLLSFSRMGRKEMSKTQVDLGALIQEVIAEFEPETKDRDLTWHIAEMPMLTGDYAMLRIVLVNLLSNALKFTRPRPHPDITVGYQQDQNGAPNFFVRDNGVGFDMAYADKLFGVFERLHGGEEFEGTGIGLANVRRIIARHGGRTWAESQVDQGATFYFSLPQAPREA